MKTFAYINAAGDVVGIGMVYLEGGGLTPEVADFVATHGEDAGLIAYGEKIKQDATLTTVAIATSAMPGGSGANYDKTFRGAFKHAGGTAVNVDVPKAKLITHDKRRAKRAAEFAPLDVQATIPSQAAAAEAARAAIRNKHAAMQTEIDACVDADSLKVIITRENM